MLESDQVAVGFLEVPGKLIIVGLGGFGLMLGSLMLSVWGGPQRRTNSILLFLLLFGGGSQAESVRRMIAEAELEGQVYLGGQVKNDELPQVYRSADLYLSASHSDGSSVSLMEALACGKAALVSAIPGNREWITPGGPGWLFADGDAPALAQGILEAARRRGPREYALAMLALGAGLRVSELVSVHLGDLYRDDEGAWRERLGHGASGGLGMLLYQGALSFEIWTGRDAPVNVMRKAIE